MSKAVDLILAKPGMDRTKSRCTFMCEGCINHWTASLQGTLGPLLEGYQIGLRSGDVESAANNLIMRVYNLFYAGRPLESLQTEYQTIIDVFVQLSQIQPKLYATGMLLMVKKLLGDGNIDKSEMDLEGIQKLSFESGNQSLHAITVMARLELNIMFQEWGNAQNLLAEAGDFRSISPGWFATGRFTLFEALISIHVAQGTTSTWLKKKKWKKRALKSMKLLRAWVRKGNMNLLHYLHLLVAELAALDGQNEKAISNYKSAITVASRNGFIHDTALSHELASAYFGSQGDAKYWKDYHMDRCLECYTEWGATAKVKQLTKG